MVLRIFLLLLLVQAAPVWSKSASEPNLSPTLEEFRAQCRLNRQGAAEFRLAQAPDRDDFIPLRALEASQSRFSFERFVSAMHKDLRKNPVTFFGNGGGWVFEFDQGRSMLPLHKTVTGIYYRGKVHIVDGHHKALSSLFLGAETIPVHLLDDWSGLEPDEFARQMESHHYSYFRNSRGARMRPRDLCDLIDDGNLQLARYLFRKVDVWFEGEKFDVLHTSGSKYPILLKINDDIPYFEFEIADALRREGVDFDPRRTDVDVGKGERKKYLKILTSKVRRGGSRLSQVLLLDRPTRVAKLQVEQIIESYIREHGCESLLSRSL